jgi:flagellar motor switch/type III secretory pathway protein FliN
LPLSAACVVANGVREQLCRALATEFEVRVIEPAVPGAAGRALLLAGATILRVGGRLCDAFVCVRPLDARRLVALAFGETEPREGTALSAIERTTLERVVLGLVPLCNALCGPLGTATPERAERAASELVSYFEVRAAAREPFAIGFGLTRDPAPEVTECITLDALSDVELQGRVEVGTGRVGVPAFARLAPQTTLAFDAPLEGNAVLRFGEVVFARGTCGVVDGRNALRIGFGESSAA